MQAVQEHIAYIIRELGKTQAKRVLIQLPAGLKNRAIGLIEALEQKGYTVFLAADDCFGACDLPLAAAESTKADAILHIGHAPFYKPIRTKMPVIYYEWPLEVELDEANLTQEIGKIKEKKIGMVSSIQYINILPRISDLIRKSGKSVEIGGHVLGCWAKAAEEVAAKADAVLFVGSGMFHPLGFKCDYFFDVERREIRDVRAEQAKWEKVRWARIMKAKDARTFGILVSTKPGQCDMQAAEKVASDLKRRDKKAFILVMDKITDASLHVDVDAFINTACPRLMDDVWSKPFINASDVEKIFE